MDLEEAQPKHGTREPTVAVGRQGLPVCNFGAGKYEHPSVPKSSGESMVDEAVCLCRWYALGTQFPNSAGDDP
eukprot:7216659-Pyramimonas_sp.AAC.1